MIPTHHTWMKHFARWSNGSRRATRWGTTPRPARRRGSRTNWMCGWQRRLGRKGATTWCFRRTGFTCI